jgi:hypothetical protein
VIARDRARQKPGNAKVRSVFRIAEALYRAQIREPPNGAESKDSADKEVRANALSIPASPRRFTLMLTVTILWAVLASVAALSNNGR